MKKLLIVLSTVTVFILSSCASVKQLDDISAVGVYGSLPVKQEIPDSNGQILRSQVVEYTYDEVVTAIKKAISVNGWYIEDYDKKHGKIIGNGITNFTITFAVYIEEISSNPESKITIIVDQYAGTFFGLSNAKGVESGALNKLTKSFNQILATY